MEVSGEQPLILCSLTGGGTGPLKLAVNTLSLAARDGPWICGYLIVTSCRQCGSGCEWLLLLCLLEGLRELSVSIGSRY